MKKKKRRLVFKCALQEFRIFRVWFLGLLSSSLLWFVVTQRFGRCILRPSSGEEMIQPGEPFYKFLWLNHFYAQVNNGHPRRAGRYNGRNVVLWQTTIKVRTIDRKIAHKILHIKPPLKNSNRILILNADQLFPSEKVTRDSFYTFLFTPKCWSYFLLD